MESTEEYPISYIWTSSDEDVATVDENGVVTAISDGEAVITATLEQNQNYSAEFPITVAAADDTVAFTSTVPEKLSAYTDCDISAAFFAGGVESDDPVEWKFSGATKSSYSVVTGDKTATIYGYGYSKNKLKVTATHGDLSVTAEIKLEGI